MTREEIEQLLVDYANEDISAANRKLLEQLFETDAGLKQEAQEMAKAMQALNRLEESSAPSAAMDRNFYAMLKNAKKQQQPAKPQAVVINMLWLKMGAAVAACVLAFFGGRYTTSPVEVIKYQKVFVKQEVPATPQVKNTVAQALSPVKTASVAHIHKREPEQVTSTLAVQLRSVFVSERIDAIMQLASKAKLNNNELKMMRLSLSEDPNANVRLTVLNTLRPLAKQQGVQNILISSLNQQSDIIVQSAILDMLIDSRSKQAIPQMIALLDDKNTDVMVQNKIRGGIESFLN